jgi:hypothetical protein
MTEHFDRSLDDPMSIEFMLDRLNGMFDRLTTSNPATAIIDLVGCLPHNHCYFNVTLYRESGGAGLGNMLK